MIRQELNPETCRLDTKIKSWCLGFLAWPLAMSEKSRYVTKASLRHITANDEASSLSGDFIIAHHSPALNLI